MTDEPLNPDDKIRIGERAEILLNDEVLSSVFQTLEETYISSWRNSPVDQSKEREDLYLLVRSVGAVKAELMRLAQDAKFETRKIDAERNAREAERKYNLELAAQLDVPVEVIERG